MSQQNSTVQSTNEPQESSTESASWGQIAAQAASGTGEMPIVSYADRLMDELFEDLERILERGSSSPSHSAAEVAASTAKAFSAPQYTAAISPIAPSSVTPLAEDGLAAVAQQEPAAELSKLEDEDADLEQLAAAASANLAVESDRPPVFGYMLERVLLVLACLSVAAAAGLWFLFQDRLRPNLAIVPGGEIPAAPVDENFLSYMDRSLEAIERRVEARRRLADVATNLPDANGTANPNAAGVAGSPPVLERIYVPVYRPPQTTTPGVMAPPIPLSPVAVAPSFPNLPSVQVAPNAPGNAPTAPAGDTPNIAPPTTIHTLVGVLELGDRSAALFEIGGTTQRIYVGESIGSSGWTLVSIRNQEAVVRRNGEVRSIYVGQRF